MCRAQNELYLRKNWWESERWVHVWKRPEINLTRLSAPLCIWVGDPAAQGVQRFLSVYLESSLTTALSKYGIYTVNPLLQWSEPNELTQITLEGPWRRLDLNNVLLHAAIILL